MKKITRLIKRNFENILSNLVSNIVWLVFVFLFSTLLSLITTIEWDFMLLIPKIGWLRAFGIYILFAVLLVSSVFLVIKFLYHFKKEKLSNNSSPHRGGNVSKDSTSDFNKSFNPKKVFISYKRNSEPDEFLALQICENITKHHKVFIDQLMPVGTRWAKKIEEEIQKSDYLICLLSAESVQSEMVIAEIETAHRLAKDNPQEKPRILPVRVNFDKPFIYPLSAYLNLINWAVWESNDDTQKVINDILTAISGGEVFLETDKKKVTVQVNDDNDAQSPLAFAQPVVLESPEGSLDPSSIYYIKRFTDDIALDAIRRNGVTITIKGPRQMGKSSLLNRIKLEANKIGKKVVYLDFQLFDKAVLEQADNFYQQFCRWFAYELQIDDRTVDYWQEPVGNTLRSTRFMENHVFKAFREPIVLAMDEVERIFDSTFRSDFFSMLRSWHNSRASNPIWKNLDFALVTSTEPYQFINDLNQSPFNVGEILELKDFTLSQVEDLNDRYGKPLQDSQVCTLMDLLSGHPYLIRRSLFLVAGHRTTFNELMDMSSSDYGPFGDHLRFHYYRMRKNPNQVKTFFEIIQTNKCRDQDMYFRLHGAGLVVKNGETYFPRNNLYANYFGKMIYDG